MNQKRKKKNTNKLNLKKIILFILIVIVVIYFFIRNNHNNIINTISNTDPNNLTSSNNSKYKTIKLDINNNYSGIGQEKVNNKDGYFTTFTTEKSNEKIYKEYKQNGKASWSGNGYWGGSMADNGCGITVMSIILSGYNKDYSPEYLREKYYPVMDYDKFGQELSKTYNIKNSDFYYDSIHLSKSSIKSHLKTNRPIIICVWNKPIENRWTTSSHYMALLAADDYGMVYVSNPNGLENNSKSSGWYNIDEVVPYIAKAIYIESYK